MDLITAQERKMPGVNLKNMDVDALLELRSQVERTLGERSKDLQRQLALLGGAAGKRRGRPAGRVGRPSVLKGKKVTPKYRGPSGETWAGRGAMPRWLAALVKEGHSVEEFAIAKGGKRGAAARRKLAAKKGRKSAPKKRGRKVTAAKEAAEAATKAT
jgi:DNA-binding protein H-NS